MPLPEGGASVHPVGGVHEMTGTRPRLTGDGEALSQHVSLKGLQHEIFELWFFA